MIVNVLKKIGLNLILIFFVFGVFTTGPYIASQLYRLFNPPSPMRTGISYSEAYPWRDEYLREWGKLERQYSDYIVWTSKPLSGRHFKISAKGIRWTKPSQRIDPDSHRYLFFGSSLILGSGSPDALTIPSIFAEINHAEAVNYGAGGHVARQSVAYLVNLYIENKIQNKKNTIIFGSGAMEAYNQYLRYRLDLSTPNENAIKSATQTPVLSAAYLFKPATQLIWNIRNYFSARKKRQWKSEEWADKAADFAADATVRSWLTASRLAKSYGDDFVAVLLPFYAVGHPRLDHLPKKQSQARQAFMRSVYARIVAGAAMYPEINFIDLTDIFDITRPIYIDKWGHYSPEGNRIFAEELTKRLHALPSR